LATAQHSALTKLAQAEASNKEASLACSKAKVANARLLSERDAAIEAHSAVEAEQRELRGQHKTLSGANDKLSKVKQTLSARVQTTSRELVTAKAEVVSLRAQLAAAIAVRQRAPSIEQPSRSSLTDDVCSTAGDSGAPSECAAPRCCSAFTAGTLTITTTPVVKETPSESESNGSDSNGSGNAVCMITLVQRR